MCLRQLSLTETGMSRLHLLLISSKNHSLQAGEYSEQVDWNIMRQFLFIIAIIIMANALNAQNSENAKENIYVQNLARKTLEKEHLKLKIDQRDFEDFKVTDFYKSKSSGISHLFIQQQYNGIPVYQKIINFNLREDENILNVNGMFVQNIKEKAVKRNFNSIPKADEIIHFLASEFQCDSSEFPELENSPINNNLSNSDKITFKSNENFIHPIEAWLEYFTVNEADQEEDLRLCWNFSVYENNQDHWWQIKVDIETGEILHKLDWVRHCIPNENFNKNNSTASNPVHQCSHISCNTIEQSTRQENQIPFNTNTLRAANPFGSYRVLPLHTENPIMDERSLVSNPWEAALLASPLGWHNDGDVEYSLLRGNNVYAKEDHSGINGIGSSPISNSHVFDYPFDPDAQPLSNENAAITNLFYWNNIMHDVMYTYGFDEESGNFQKDNYNRGGIENDYIFADAQDGSGFDNANFVSPPDGEKARMQMFIWSAPPSTKINILSPSQITGTHIGQVSSFGPAFPLPGNAISGYLVKANDGSANPSQACFDLQNNSAINGNIALIERGNCSFTTKVKQAQDAGATACIVCNNANVVATMVGSDPSINIPSMMVSSSFCEQLSSVASQNISIEVYQTGTNNNIDGDFDNGIIAHEYAHGISTRLVGGPSNANCLFNQEQMSEGFSDFFGLIMTMKGSSEADRTRSIGSYVKGQSQYETGIRAGRYSTDPSINNYNYGDICLSQFNSVHGVGFIWNTMLWDMTWAMIDKYGYDADLYNGNSGNNRAIQLVVDGLKLLQCNPGFTDARDAILLADEVNYGGANQCLLWTVFANRGLGYSANQGSTDNRCDGSPAFDLPPHCMSDVSIEQSIDPNWLSKNGNLINLELTAQNNTPNFLNNLYIKDTLPAGLTFMGSEDCPVNSTDFGFDIDISQLGSYQSKVCNLSMLVNTNNTANMLLVDSTNNFDLFESESYFNVNNWTTVNGNYQGGTSYFVPNLDKKSDTHLLLRDEIYVDQPNSVLWFAHYFDTEHGFDGGVVEVSRDNGNSWVDLGDKFYENGYTNQIEVNPESPISGRSAFTGNSVKSILSKIDLSDFLGDNIRLRFRMGSDAFVKNDGWYIHGIWLMTEALMENTVWINDQNGNKNSNTIHQQIYGTSVTSNSKRLKLKVFLEGAMPNQGLTMKTALRENSLVPNNHPFNTAPWNYTGTESLDNFANLDVVDWLLVEIRNGVDGENLVSRKAVVLSSSGEIYSNDGQLGIKLLGMNVENNQDYHVVVRHYNHLPAMTETPVNLYNNDEIDFSDPSGMDNNLNLRKSFNGKFVLYAGDYDHNGIINNLDFNAWNLSNALVYQWVSWDGDLNGIVNNLDYNIWFLNRSKVGKLPFE